MATSYKSIIAAAVSNAMRGIPPNQMSSGNAEFIAQTLFPITAQAVSEMAAADPAKRSLLRKNKTMTLVAGEATLDDDVLTKYFADATLLNTSNLNWHYTYRDYPDFIRRGDKRYGIFTRNEETLMVVDPKANFTQPLTATGSRLLVVPCVVLTPANADDDVDAPDELTSDLIEALTESLRGMMTKSAGMMV